MSDKTAARPAKSLSKATIMVKMLSRARGASLDDLTVTTGWQPHSIRAFLSGLRKTGVTLAREPRRDGAMAYRIVNATTAQQAMSEEAADA